MRLTCAAEIGIKTAVFGYSQLCRCLKVVLLKLWLYNFAVVL